MTIPIVADPTLNPWSPTAFVESIFVNRVLFAGVTKPGKDLLPVGDLATKWEVSADGLNWTFTLRGNVKWSDGAPFSAEDVAFTFNDVVLNRALGATGRGNFANVLKQVTVIDPLTVRFELLSRFSALPSYLAHNAGILPKHVLSGGNPLTNTAFNKSMPVTTGPFKVENFSPGQSVVLTRNDDYFGDKAHLDKLVFRVVPDANTQIAQALSGEIQIMLLDNKAAVERVQRAPNLKVFPRQLVQYYWLALNQTDERFQDVRVRQAFLYAINRPAIINSVEKGYGKVANSPITPALAAYYDPTLEREYAHDPERAKRLLTDAGWRMGGDGVMVKDGKPFQFTMDVAQRGILESVNELIQQDLKKVGIIADLSTREWNAYIQKVVVRRDYVATVNWWVYPSDPDVLPYFHSTAAGRGFNIPGFKDPKLDDLLSQGQAASELQQRKAIYKQLQRYMADNLPYVFLWYPEEINVISTALQGVSALSMRDGMHYVQEWWLAKR